MTQMMLFDTCSLAPTALLATPAVVAQPVSTATNHSNDPAPRPEMVEPGVHQLGDLARLVLLRYQLVAQRRQAIQQRRQSVAR